jgi:hypothetical protein
VDGLLAWFSGEGLVNHHHDFSLAAAVELAEKDSLPATEQQLAIFEWNCDAGTDQTGLNVGVGIFFAVAKVHSVLRNQGAKSVKHVARDIRISILVDRQTGCGVLTEKHDHAVLRPGFLQLLLDLFSEFDEFFALMRADFERVHIIHRFHRLHRLDFDSGYDDSLEQRTQAEALTN